MNNCKLLILGTRGIPAGHGGFETFAERLAIYLNQKGWEVVVYCQGSGKTKTSKKDWNGITLIEIPVSNDSALCSIIFDFKATLDALKQQGTILVLGYNTAIFSLFYYLKKSNVITNMDGMEWCRSKWSLLEKAWLYINEKCAIKFSTHLIADHPQIKKHYLDHRIPASKIDVIPYCSDLVRNASIDCLDQYNLTQDRYAMIVARPEPENSILEIVSAFSKHPRGYKLVILGNYYPNENAYHKQVLAVASEEVIFLGAIFNPKILQSLRYYARLYIHGHTVGGTNPSLVEALAAGMPVLAHLNRFNYWVAGEDARYFYDQEGCSTQLDNILDNTVVIRNMRKASLLRYQAEFSNNKDLEQHERILMKYVTNQKTEDREQKESVYR